ncbi:MAG TPA: ferritin-like domain-containing protein [Thermoleophilaceae bacterium]|nr:ferritin-like domain-containing protein [Thermoleophilaceae bacterium]
MSGTTTPAEKDSALTRLTRDPISRRRFVAAAGGTTAISTLLVACGDDDDSGSRANSDDMSTTTEMSGSNDAIAQFGKGDVGILNYALTLEYIEDDFYRDVIGSGLFKGADLELIRSFGKDEAAHVAALTQTVRKLGAKPAPKPKTKFPLDDARSVLELAATVENLGAAAYLGQAPRIESDAVLAAALSIHAVEGRHAAALNTLTEQSFVPDGAFAKPADAATVLDSVQPFLVG